MIGLRIKMAFDKYHVDLSSIEECLRHNLYPDGVVEKGEKANFRMACKKFSIGRFMYKGKRLMITNKNEGINATPHPSRIK